MENKKMSFVLYHDIIESVELLSKEQTGELFISILKLVNNIEYEINDGMVKMAFIPIKNQIERDSKKWNDTIGKRSKSGKEGNLKKYHPEIYKDYKKGVLTLEKAEKLAYSRKSSQSDKNIAVNVNGIVNDTVNVNVNEREKTHALNFLREYYPERFKEASITYLKGIIKSERNDFISKFNNKVILENLPFEENKLFACLENYAISWKQNQKKNLSNRPERF